MLHPRNRELPRHDRGLVNERVPKTAVASEKGTVPQHCLKGTVPFSSPLARGVVIPTSRVGGLLAMTTVLFLARLRSAGY
jgi:hypothetical protein